MSIIWAVILHNAEQSLYHITLSSTDTPVSLNLKVVCGLWQKIATFSVHSDSTVSFLSAFSTCKWGKMHYFRCQRHVVG
jgi:hypothetical protein